MFVVESAKEKLEIVSGVVLLPFGFFVEGVLATCGGEMGSH